MLFLNSTGTNYISSKYDWLALSFSSDNSLNQLTLQIGLVVTGLDPSLGPAGDLPVKQSVADFDINGS